MSHADDPRRSPPPPDALAIAIQTVREELLRAEPANQALFEDALCDAELRARRILGGQRHYIQRLPTAERVAIIELLPANLSIAQIVERTGLPRETVRRALAAAGRRSRAAR